MNRKPNDQKRDDNEQDEPNAIWPEFRAWLMARDLGKGTARTYATQVRRLVREVADQTPESLCAWIAALPAHHRTPYRSAWRAYRDFMQEQYSFVLPDFAVSEGLPEPVLEALVAVKNSGTTATAMERLTTTLDTGPRHAALARINKDLAEGLLVAVCDAQNNLHLIPEAAYEILLDWGAQDAEAPGWLIPSAPGASTPMPAMKLTRAINRHVRKATP